MKNVVFGIIGLALAAPFLSEHIVGFLEQVLGVAL